MNDIYQNIEALCKEKGIRPSTLATAAGVSRSILSDLKSGRSRSLSAGNLSRIAAYFGVSVERLLGVEEQKPDILDQVDVAFYGDYKTLSEEDKEMLRQMAKRLMDRKERQRG